MLVTSPVRYAMVALLLVACGSGAGGARDAPVTGDPDAAAPPDRAGGTGGAIGGTGGGGTGGGSGSGAGGGSGSGVGGGGGMMIDLERTWTGASFSRHPLVVVDGPTLFGLDKYRGLTVADVAQPDRMTVVARLPLGGTPVALYRRGTTLFAVANGRLTHVSCPMCPTGVSAVYGAAVVAIDVADRARPVVRGQVDLEGAVFAIRPAASGNALHAVTAVLASDRHLVGATRPAPGVRAVVIDTAEPARIRVSGKLDVGVGASDPVVEMADARAYVLARVEAPPRPCQVVTATGETRAAPSCMRLVAVNFSSATPTAGASVDLRFFSQLQWRNGVLRAASFLYDPAGYQLEVHSFESRTPGELRRLGAGALSIPTVGAPSPILDGARVLVVPGQTGAPLRIIDLADPARPVVRGTVELGAAGTPGTSAFVSRRVIGDRLLALWQTATALELVAVDLADPANPRVAQRLPVATGTLVEGRDQVLSALGVPEPASVVLVPFDVTQRGPGSSVRSIRGGVHAFTVAANGALADAGVAEVALGYNERLATDGARLFSVSDARVQAFILEEGRLRGRGTTPPVIDVYASAASPSGLVATTVEPRNAVASLLRLSGPTLDDPGPSLSLDQPPEQLLARGDVVYMIGPFTRFASLGQIPAVAGGVAPPARTQRWAAELVGSGALVMPMQREYECAGTPAAPRCADWNHDLLVISFERPSAPQLVWRGPVADPTVPLNVTGIQVRGNTVLVSLRLGLDVPPRPGGTGGSGGGQPPPDLPRRWRYWLVEVDLAAPDRPRVGPPREVPGAYLGDVAGTSYALEDVDTAVFRLHSYRMVGDRAEPLAAVTLDQVAFRVALGPQAAYFAARGKLGVIDLRDPRSLRVDGRFDLVGAAYHPDPVYTTWFDLAYAERVLGPSLIVSLDGWVLTYDVRDPLRPVWRSAIPTRFSATRLSYAADGSRAFVAGGRYPVAVIEASPSLP